MIENDVTQRFQEILNRCQSWIDNEKYIPKKFKIKSRSDEFAEKIVHELETVMIREKFCFRNGKIFLPTFYFVEISPADNFEFRGQKRDILGEELNKFVERYLRMFSIESRRTSFVQVVANSKLKKDEIKVIHQWEENYSPKISFNDYSKNVESVESEDFSEKTVVASAFWIKGDVKEEECETLLGKKFIPLYKLEITRNGITQNTLPVFHNEIIIGRGSQTRPVDVSLPDDLEISRQHASLIQQTKDVFKLSILGRNAAFAAEQYVAPGRNAILTWGNDFQIGSYLLSIQR